MKAASILFKTGNILFRIRGCFMRMVSVKTLKNATSGRLWESLDISWMYRERDDCFDEYHPEQIWYIYNVYCPDELLSEFYDYVSELEILANELNKKVLARLPNVKVMAEILPMRFLFSKCEYNRKFLNIYLEEMKLLAKPQNTNLILPLQSVKE